MIKLLVLYQITILDVNHKIRNCTVTLESVLGNHAPPGGNPTLGDKKNYTTHPSPFQPHITLCNQDRNE